MAARLLLLVWLVMLSGYDIRWRRLPNWLTLPGAAVLTVVYLAVHLIQPAGLGAGDVKLAVGVGALTGLFGFETWLFAAIAAPLLTALLALVALGLRGVRSVPHGPSMCLASAVATALATS